MKREMFVITAAALNSLTNDEVVATIRDMKELGICKLPYESVDIRIAGDPLTYCIPTPQFWSDPQVKEMLQMGVLVPQRGIIHGEERDYIGSRFGDGFWMEFLNVSLNHTNYEKYSVMNGCKRMFDSRLLVWGCKNMDGTEVVGATPEERDAIAYILIVLLATRNAVKDRKHNKLAKLGIGCKKDLGRYEYVTTISVPPELEDDAEHKPGKEKAAHLRRGHIRNQRHGPQFSMVRKIWIEPVFVNADKDWVSTRERYNVSL